MQLATPSITAMHAVLPQRIRTAAEVDEMVDASVGWTARRTGVLLRHVAAADESVADMGAQAVTELLANEGLDFSGIDAIVAACATREQFLPSTASLIANRLGDQARGIPAFDIDASCLSFVLALDLMSRAIATGMYRRILLVSTELPTRGQDPTKKEAVALFGDAAVAAVLSAGDSTIDPVVSRIGACRFETFAEGAHFTELRVGSGHNPNVAGYEFDADDFRFLMDGPKAFQLASREFPGFLDRFLVEADLTLDDFDYIVPHQASKPAVELLARRLGVGKDRYAQDYQRFGNTVSASIPLGLHMARREGRVRSGDRVLLAGTAAGLTMGAMAVEI